jgi:hypothetical protein
MSLNVETPSVTFHVSTDVTTFNFSFTIYNTDTDISVVAYDWTTDESITLPAYTVTNNAPSVGGSIEFAESIYTGSDIRLKIYRSIPLEQQSTYDDDEPLMPNTIEASLDITNARIQDIAAQVSDIIAEGGDGGGGGGSSGDGVSISTIVIDGEGSLEALIPQDTVTFKAGTGTELSIDEDGSLIIASIGIGENSIDLACNASDIALGSAVYIDGDSVAVLAIATAPATLAYGILITRRIVRREGLFPESVTLQLESGITLADGDILYLSDTEAGKITNIEPEEYAMILGQYRDDAAVLGGTYISGTAITHHVHPFRGCLAYKTSSQSISSGSSASITFTAEDYDTDTIHNNSTNTDRMTVPTGISYVRLSGLINLSGNASNLTDVSVAIWKNGNVLYFPYISATTEQSKKVAICSPAMAVTSGDYFTVVVYATTSLGGAFLVSGHSSTYQSQSRFGMEIL